MPDETSNLMEEEYIDELEDGKTYTARQVEVYLEISPGTLLNRCRDGLIRYKKVPTPGGPPHRVFTRRDILEYQENMRLRDAGKRDRKASFFLFYEKLHEMRPLLKKKRNEMLYEYHNGWYERLSYEDVSAYILRELRKANFIDKLTISNAKNVLACWESMDEVIFREWSREQRLCFENCLVDLFSGERLPHDPDFLTPYHVPVVYDPTATCPRWDLFMNEITDGDEAQVRLLHQIAGYCLTSSVKYQKAFILYGKGGNGKSVFTKILERIVGADQSFTAKLASLSKPFALTGLMEKRLYSISEIPENNIETDILKTLIDGSTQTGEIKFKQEMIQFQPVCKVVISANRYIRTSDQSEGYYRRFIVVPFNTSFIGREDFDLVDKLWEERAGIVNRFLAGALDLFNNGFAVTQKNVDCLREYRLINSPLFSFLSDLTYVEYGEAFRVSLNDLYAKYGEYCKDVGHHAKSLTSMVEEIRHLTVHLPGYIEIVGREVIGLRLRFFSGMTPADIKNMITPF